MTDELNIDYLTLYNNYIEWLYVYKVFVQFTDMKVKVKWWIISLFIIERLITYFADDLGEARWPCCVFKVAKLIGLERESNYYFIKKFSNFLKFIFITCIVEVWAMWYIYPRKWL